MIFDNPRFDMAGGGDEFQGGSFPHPLMAALVNHFRDNYFRRPPSMLFPSLNRTGDRESLPYQSFLRAVQERRDARAGVPAVPPQGAASPSAQRRIPMSFAGSRSF